MKHISKDDNLSLLLFRSPELSDRAWIDARMRESNFQNCDYSFGDQYIWAKPNHIRFAEVGGFYCAVGGEDGKMQYNYPAGAGDVRPVIETLRADAAERGIPFEMRGMDAATAKAFEGMFPGEFTISADRDSCDYIYSVERLTKLSGKKLHGKRNHINRFCEQNWSYEAITRENIEDARKMSEEWCLLYNCTEDPSLDHEACAVHCAFENFFALGFLGGLLRVDERVVAFAMGEALNSDTFVVHIEKAFAEMQGAYPMINQQFLKQNGAAYTYVNREEDLGDEGLRRAKLSYYPDYLLEKFTAVPR